MASLRTQLAPPCIPYLQSEGEALRPQHEAECKYPFESCIISNEIDLYYHVLNSQATYQNNSSQNVGSVVSCAIPKKGLLLTKPHYFWKLNM